MVGLVHQWWGWFINGGVGSSMVGLVHQWWLPPLKTSRVPAPSKEANSSVPFLLARRERHDYIFHSFKNYA